MSTRWQYQLTETAIRDIERLPPQMRARIFDALERLVDELFTPRLRKLQGARGEWRLRVGDWRIRVERDDPSRTIHVLRVLPRGSAYRD